MKKLVVVALAMAAATTMYAQATVSMLSDNAVTFGDKINPADPYVAGEKLGSAFSGVLMYGEQAVTSQPFAMSSKGAPTGKMKGDVYTDTTGLIPAGATVEFWVKVDQDGYYGQSLPFKYATGDNGAIPPSTPEASLTFDSFTVNYTAVPEPTTIALGILGLSSLLLFRRRD